MMGLLYNGIKRRGQDPALPYCIKELTYLEASSTATAHATVAPTIGLLPIPIRPIISTQFFIELC